MTRVAGGQIIRSTLVQRSPAPCMILPSSAAEALSPFIFQLPATSGRRVGSAIVHPSNQRLAERSGPRQRPFAAIHASCGAVGPPLYSGAFGRKSAAHPDKTNGFMLRGIHKASSNWIGRAVMGVVLGLIAISFGIWGIGDIFRGFGTNTVAKVGRHRNPPRHLPPALPGPAAADQPPVEPADPARPGPGAWPRPAVAQRGHRRNRARRAGPRAAAQRQRCRGRPPDHRCPGLQGHHRPVRPRAVRGLPPQHRQHRSAVHGRAAQASRFAQQLLGTISGEAPVPKTALDAFNRFQNEERVIEYVTLGAAQAGDIAEPAPEVLAKYFEERKVVFRAPEFRKITLVVLTPEDLASRIEVSDADLKKAYTDRRARYETPERRHLKQIVFPNMEEAKAAADKLARKGNDVRGAGRRARAEGQRHRSRHRGQTRRGRSRRRRRRLRAQVRRGQRAGRRDASASRSSRSTASRPARPGRSRKCPPSSSATCRTSARRTKSPTCRKRSRTSGSAARRWPTRRASSISRRA